MAYCAARNVWLRRDQLVPHPAYAAMSWEQWWEAKFGQETGMKYHEYVAAHAARGGKP